MKKKWTITYPLPFLLLLFTSSSHLFRSSRNTIVQAQSTSKQKPEEIDHGERLIEWVRSSGGVVNQNLTIRRADPDDPTSRFGMFTTGNLAKKDVLLVIPEDCVINSEQEYYDEDDNDDQEEDEEPSQLNCNTVRELITELHLGGESHYAPYVNYLLAQPHGQLPSAWSREGKEFLVHLLESFTIDALPPAEPTDWIYEWYEYCDGSNDPFEENAAMMVLRRSWDNLLIPVYDMMSHRNGRHFNTETDGVHGEDVVVRASRDIEAGEEIYTSYNMCEDCGNRAETYGTPDILRDYGFVEQYPQRWIFIGKSSVGFEIDEVWEGEDEGGNRGLSLSWIGDPADVLDIDVLEDIREGMNVAGETKLKNPPASIPEGEITTIRQYHEALTNAVELALEVSYGDDEACSAGTTGEGNVCIVPSERYDDLTQDSDQLEYRMQTCNISEFIGFMGYDIIEQTKTPYQSIAISHNPTTKDTCLDLDSTVQICTSYRPHYHEMSVHYAARYIPVLQRVLFVGGGDSMLLHEILKYPAIEQIVGLELDQQVTRTSFRYFGTQPHWDDERVEWWFGDATKSLAMLPADYFGSFDMVLVDLSETVMSAQVADELDIMQALSLLLTPNGIMLKNELYFETMEGIFEHTLQYFDVGVPVLCSQAMVLGSNGVNFARFEKLTDHGATSLLLTGPLNDEAHFGLYHDYAWNADNKRHFCKHEVDELERVPLRQSSSPGIIIIAEVENIATSSFEGIVDRVVSTVGGQGFHILSTVVPGVRDDIIVVVMKEGYIVLRLSPHVNYCGIDVHLWGSFQKQENLKKSILCTISNCTSCTTSSSSFRIVAGGMFGVDTWRTDEEARGPRRTLDCDHDRDQDRHGMKDVKKDMMTTADIDFIIEEHFKFIPENATVLVICGGELMTNYDHASKQSYQSCRTYNTLQENDKMSEVLKFSSCANDANESFEDADIRLYMCEREFRTMLERKLAGRETKIGAIIIDPTMPYSMGQVLFRVFKNWKTRNELLADDSTVVAVSVNDIDSSWRNHLVNRFRTNIIAYAPVFKVDLSFEAIGTFIGLHIVTRDETTFFRLRESLTRIEERTGVRAKVERVLGGTQRYDRNFSLDRTFTPDDYGQTYSYEQWRSQHPLEVQTILQLEIQGVRRISRLLRTNIKTALEDFLSSNSIGSLSREAVPAYEFPSVGDGCLFVAIWNFGSIIIIWDGRTHIDINLTANDGDKRIFGDKVEANFINKIPSLKTILRDEQPRGYGRVVNFSDEIKNDSNLYWKIQ